VSKRTLVKLFSAVLIFLAGVAGNYSIPAVRGTATDMVLVTKVIDGDTIEVEDEKKVRLIGVDTPETVDPKRPDGCFGKQASDFTKSALTGKMVRLEKDVSETDKYGRLLRYVWIDGVMFNETLLRNGMAQVSTYPPDVKYQKHFSDIQADARKEKRGLWNECFVKDVVNNDNHDVFDILVDNADRIIRTIVK